MLRSCRSLLLLALLASLVALAAASSAASTHTCKAHAVSKSSHHTSAGRVRDSSREYAGQGSSHLKHALHPRDVPAELGSHLADPAIYAEMQSLALSSLGSAGHLPTIDDAASGAPEQVKVSLTQRQGEMVFNWLTWASTNSSTVKWGLQSGVYTGLMQGQQLVFTDPNSLHIIRYIHNVLVPDLPAATKLFYVVGDESSVWSAELTVSTVSYDSTVQTVAVYGDMGVVNSQSMKYLAEEVAQGTIDLVVHVGDFAYNMDELQGMTGDVFFEEFQNVTSALPYMGTCGNHEQAFNFSHFTNKFSNWNYIVDPAGGADQNWWYSWDSLSGGSNVHWISIDSELYYWLYANPTAGAEEKGNYLLMIQKQWNWIVSDLTAAYDSGKYDWIVAYSHRPMYCSNVDDMPDCSTDAELLRLGVPSLTPGQGPQWGLEAALSVRPVDLYFAAHEHSYERTLPVRNGVIDQQQNSGMYINPLYPVHIVTGAGGCREYYDYYDSVFYGPWSVVRSSTYGYGHLRAYNSTHLHWEQLLDEGAGGTDSLWIIKKGKQQQQSEDEPVERQESVDTIAIE